ncbi:MAG: acetoacetate metabolism regulatory protein AtoC [Parcubacteria group bacterium Gr01-1014_33]|nr:MAG: acetoacetate metabolism regulatory protein AtoC [Parcubacteria group bacterium Gr01-1014_33]
MEMILPSDKFFESSCPYLVGSQLRKRILRQLWLATQMADTILILGETGTGKELVARAIHEFSLRANNPFIPVNCSAVPDSLAESLLFGHERGAFTDAKNQHTGFITQAHTGILFLDEISTLDKSVQAKILRVLQEREFERLGGKGSIKVDVQIIAATNENLKSLADQGKFRLDLFYRLDEVSFITPPLRERIGDVEELAKHFIKKFCQKWGLIEPGITDEGLLALQIYHWGGNVRELENRVRGALIHSVERKGDLCPEDFRLTGSKRGVVRNAEYNIAIAYEVAERRCIEEALLETKGNRDKAADLVGISRASLYRKLKEYGMTSSDRNGHRS